MPLHYCDLYATSMYLHKRKSRLSLCEEFSRLYMSSPFIKQLICSKFVHNPLFIYKVQILLSKTVRSASRCNWSASKIIMMMSYWQVHCDQIFANNLPWRIYRAINMHLIVSTLSFCIQLNTFIRLGIANSFIFVIFPCCYFLCDLTVNIFWSD